MLHSVMRSSMVMASTTGPTNSMERYVAPATPMSPMICKKQGFEGLVLSFYYRAHKLHGAVRGGRDADVADDLQYERFTVSGFKA